MSNRENTQEYSKDILRIQIVDSNGKPIPNAEVVLLAMGQKVGQKIALPDKTNFQGETLFNIQEHIKNINRFEITINHPDYYSYPINRNRKICRSYEYGHLCVESFAKIPTFYFNGKMLNVSHYSNPTKTYALKTLLNQDSNNQTQKEYYIQLQSNQKSFNIYKDGNLTQESEYILHLEDSSQTTTQPEKNKNLNFDNDDTLRKFKKEIESIIKMNEKKGNIQSIHKFIIDYDVPFAFLNKDTGRVNITDLPYSSISQEVLANKLESNKLYIVKSWFNGQVVEIDDVRPISLQTMDIINRKDMSRNPLIYKALDKLIEDYKVYKDNFPQDYYVEFGRYITEESIKFHSSLYENHYTQQSNIVNIVNYSIGFWRRYLDNNYKKEWAEGGAAIFHLYENYVPKYNGDENGLDKVLHFLESARLCFMKSAPQSLIAGYIVEVGDWLKQKGGGKGTGFDKGDIAANKKGIEYGNELRIRYGKII